MKSSIAMKIALVVILCVATQTLLGCGRDEEKPSDKMTVAVSIGPLGDFARQVGKDRVDVHVLVQPGASPHTYQLTTDQMAVLSRASVLVLNGAGLEFWADKAIDAANNPNLLVVRTANGLPLIDLSDGHDGGNERDSGDPHVWLDPIYAIHQVEMIRDAFVLADPAQADTYIDNAERYVEQLKQLDRDIRTQVRTFKSMDLIAFHSAWVYFAREYGLNLAAVIQETPAKDPSPSELGEVIETCRRVKAKAIFAEPQFSPKAAQVIANECGAEVLMLDPMGKPPKYDYIANMRNNLKQISKALGPQ